MRIGIGAGGRTVERARGYVRAAAEEGFASAWFSNIFGLDAVMACALTGSGVPIEVGTAVMPVHPRHPQALAQEALTAYDACDGRFTLGIGFSATDLGGDIVGLS